MSIELTTEQMQDLIKQSESLTTKQQQIETKLEILRKQETEQVEKLVALYGDDWETQLEIAVNTLQALENELPGIPATPVNSLPVMPASIAKETSDDFTL